MRWPWARPEPEESESHRQEVLLLISRRLKECEDSLRRDPNNLDALFTKGVFLARINEYWRAIDCLNKVTDQDPAYPGVWHLKYSLYRRVGDFGAAIRCRELARSD